MHTRTSVALEKGTSRIRCGCYAVISNTSLAAEAATWDENKFLEPASDGGGAGNSRLINGIKTVKK